MPASTPATSSSIDAGARTTGAPLECAFRVMRLRAPAYARGDGRCALALGLTRADIDRASTSAADAGDDEGGGWGGGGATGALALPRSFGTVSLGETFACVVSFGNFSRMDGDGKGVDGVGRGRTAREVGIKIELQTETRRTTLHDATREPIAVLRPGEKRDVVVSKDVKELGAHTLVCSAAYCDENGERRYSPQYFKFKVSNPLSVRTKTRAAPRGRIFLEVCVENATRNALLLEGARFDAVDGIMSRDMTPENAGQATRVDVGENDRGPGLPSIGKRAVYRLDPTGGSAHFLYEITSTNASTTFAPTTPLGKLELRWRGAMGDLGRLQTQVINAGSAGSSDPVPEMAKIHQTIIVDPKPANAEEESTVYVERPFTLRARIEALAPVEAGAFALRVRDVVTGVYVDGPRAFRIESLDRGQTVDVDVSCVALGLGVQTCPTLALCGAVDGALLHAPTPLEVFVVRDVPEATFPIEPRPVDVEFASLALDSSSSNPPPTPPTTL